MKSKPAIAGGNPIRKDVLVFGSPDIQDQDIVEVVDTLKSGWLSTGPKTTKFENEFRAYKKSENAVALASCTAALYLGINALGLQPGDEIISTDLTFSASISTIVHNNLVPVLCDVNKDTQNMDCSQIEEKITPRTRAILPVHMCGYPCDMSQIMQIAEFYNLHVIEDCAHAIESTVDGKHCGTFGDFGAFSFYVTKNISCGEGGMLITNSKDIESNVRLMSLHGLSKNAHTRYSNSGFKHYSVLNAGYKYNMTDISASLAINQLTRIEESWSKRQHVWNRYKKELVDLPLYLPTNSPPNTKHSYHLFTVHLDLEAISVSRDFVLNALLKEGIGTGVHYKAIHTHPFYSNTFGWTPKEFPNAQWISDRTISLPLSSKLTDDDVDDVITALTKILIYYKR